MRLADVTPDWLTDALQREFPGARVADCQPFDVHSGTTTRARLRLTAAPGAASAKLPASVFVKLAASDIPTRIFTSLANLGRTEVGVLRDAGDALPVERPRSFHACAAHRGSRFVIVMEDLVATGCEFPGFDAPLSLEGAREVARELAALHAAFWRSPRLAGDLAWLRCAETRPSTRLERCLAARSTRVALARVGDGIPDAVRHGVREIDAWRRRLDVEWAREPRTLLHGDCHVGNLYFRRTADATRAGLLDWQVAQRGHGMRDLGYFLVSSLPSELRREHERALIDFYRDELVAHGIPAPDRDDLWWRYRTVALYTWIAAAVTVAVGGLQSDAVGRLALHRAATAMADLDSLEALRELAGRPATPA